MTPNLPAPLFVDLEAAAKLLDISHTTMRELVELSGEHGIEVPKVDVGRRPKFEVALLSGWFKEAARWRTSDNSQAASGKSGGRSPATTASPPSARSRARRNARATNSSQRSRSAKSSASAIGPNLASIVFPSSVKA